MPIVSSDSCVSESSFKDESRCDASRWIAGATRDTVAAAAAANAAVHSKPDLRAEGREVEEMLRRAIETARPENLRPAGKALMRPSMLSDSRVEWLAEVALRRRALPTADRRGMVTCYDAHTRRSSVRHLRSPYSLAFHPTAHSTRNPGTRQRLRKL